MPTYTKTTELRGAAYQFNPGEGGEEWIVSADRLPRHLVDLIPDQCHDDIIAISGGPRGTFRITVEFTPDE